MLSRTAIFVIAVSYLHAGQIASEAPKPAHDLVEFRLTNAIFAPPQAPGADPPKPHDRMEDKGCCVIKKSKYKPEWDYSDDESRRLCIETAHKAGFDYDFYKDQKCAQVK